MFKQAGPYFFNIGREDFPTSVVWGLMDITCFGRLVSCAAVPWATFALKSDDFFPHPHPDVLLGWGGGGCAAGLGLG